MQGKTWQDMDAIGMAHAKEAGTNIQMVDSYEQLQVDMRNTMQALDAERIESVADRGVDAKAALEAFRNYQK